MTSAHVFEYVAWFRDASLPPEDQDHEWPGVVYISADNADAALAWGNHLAQSCSDELISSTVEPWLDSVPTGGPFTSDGEILSAADLGW